MRKNLLLFVFMLLAFYAKAQYPYVTCVDSTRINLYFNCTDDYNPQCGCDGITYRSICAANNWGGLYTSQNYRPGSCGNFDFDFVPNPIVPGTLFNSYGTLSIYSNLAPVSVIVQIYDIFGRIWYVQQLTIGSPQSIFVAPSIYMDGFPQGLYYLFVTINGEALKKKIMKVDRI